MDETPRFRFPFILPGQAQKELYHNEALTIIDMALHAAVEEGPRADPPVAPLPGQTWIVAAGGSGEWAGKADFLALWTESGWRFLAPQAGMSVLNRALGYWIHYDGSGWATNGLPVASLVIGGEQVVGPRQPSILSPSGGTIIDQEARTAIAALIATLISHGLTD